MGLISRVSSRTYRLREMVIEYTPTRQRVPDPEEATRLQKQEATLLDKLLLPSTEPTTETPPLTDNSAPETPDEITILDSAPLESKVWHDDADAGEQKKISVNRLRNTLRKGLGEQVLEGEEYQARIDEVFLNANKQPSWLKRKHEEASGGSSDDGDQGTKDIRARRYLKKVTKHSSISINHLDIRRCEKDVVLKANNSKFKSLRFHTTKPLLGNIGHKGKHVQLTQLDGVENAILDHTKFDTKDKLVDICFDNDNRLFALTNFKNKHANNRWQCHIFERDLVTGPNQHHKNIRGLDSLAAKRFIPSPDGSAVVLYNNQPSAQLSILSLKNSNLQITRTIRQSSKIVDAVTFRTAANDFGLATLAQDGECLLWDLRFTKRCAQSLQCPGIVRATRLAVSPKHGKSIAIGGHSGYVSMYSFANDCLVDSTENVSPVKEFQNLTTAINSLEFGGPNGELLAFSSCGNWTGNEDEEALSSYIKKSEGNFSKYSDAGLIKIAHVASRQVYSQFPQQTSERGQLGIIQHSMFSPNGKFMLVQNSKGKLPLYRLGHNFSY